MKKIKLRITENVIEVTERPEIITSGTIGLPVEFSFDSQWDGLSKIAIFRAGEKQIVIADPDNEITVPWEVLENPHEWLSIGIYGVNEYGTVVIPTVWVDVAKIHTGANPEGDETTDPTLPVWAQIQSQLDHITPESIGAAPMAYTEEAIDAVRESLQEVRTVAFDNETAMNNHCENTENPHGVTAEQIGAISAGEVADMVSNENVPVIVTLGDSGMASHATSFIYDSVWLGKTVFLSYEGNLYPCTKCDPDIAEFAVFHYGDNLYRCITVEREGIFAITDKMMAAEDFVHYKVDEHAQNQDNPHGVTAAQVGAAPAGYGLGENDAKAKSWNGIWQNGFFRESNDSPDGKVWYGVVCKNYGGIQAQLAFKNVSVGASMIMAIRQNNKSSNLDNFEPWEYVNPPMLEGVEYRTVERRNGKAVYKKLVGDVVYWRVDGSEKWKQ